MLFQSVDNPDIFIDTAHNPDGSKWAGVWIRDKAVDCFEGEGCREKAMDLVEKMILKEGEK